MKLPTNVEYPVIAIGDLHGRAAWFDQLLSRLERLPEWPAARLVFLGDLVDRGDAVRELVARVIAVIAERPGSTCVMGNHDLALAGAAGLGCRAPSDYWVRRYRNDYDHANTFTSYLGRLPDTAQQRWPGELADLKAAIPEKHQTFLANLPWVVEAPGHIFLHNGLSPELDCPATTQLEFLRRKRWVKEEVQPRFGSETDRRFTPDYPVWLGADKNLSARPLAMEGKVQVTGHRQVDAPDVNAVRIRIDTSGGTREPLTACLLRGPSAQPEFITSNG